MRSFLLGADHAGFSLKEVIKTVLQRQQVHIEDLSPVYVEGDDYPQVAQAIAQQIAKHSDLLGVLICDSGFGMAIAANRYKGVRAVVVRSAEEAKQAREHNHANILVLGERFTSAKQAQHILETWIHTNPSQAHRHVRRIHALDTSHE